MKYVDSLEVKGKKVFLRVDFNVPLDDEGNITDDSRIKAALPTIKYLVENRAKLIIASHLGRPKGEFKSKLSLKPAAQRLSELLSSKVIMSPDSVGEEVEKSKEKLKEGQILLLENLRFHPGEKENDPSYTEQLAQQIDCYVNDAFGACHRAHASVVGIAEYVPEAAAGFLIKKELKYLGKAVHSPQKPYVAILGGAKVSDKIPVIENLLNKADRILMGGAMAYTFFSAQGYQVGRSKVEKDKKEMAGQLLKKSKNTDTTLHLPLDHVVASEPDSSVQAQIVDSLPIPSGLMGLDIGPKTIHKYSSIIAKAKTIFWNGPMGVFEVEQFAQGTFQIAQAVSNTQALSIVGGGDSASAVAKAGVSHKISHVSTGGGASLEYIAKEILPGLEALKE